MAYLYGILTSSRSVWGIARYGTDRINFWPWPRWPWPLTFIFDLVNQKMSQNPYFLHPDVKPVNLRYYTIWYRQNKFLTLTLVTLTFDLSLWPGSIKKTSPNIYFLHPDVRPVNLRYYSIWYRQNKFLTSTLVTLTFDLDLWPRSTKKLPKTYIFFILTSSRSIWGITRYGTDRINFWPWPRWPWPLTLTFDLDQPKIFPKLIFSSSWRQAGQFEVLHDMVQTESIFDLDLGDLDLWPWPLT